MATVSRNNAEHYIWGDHCDGWHLLKDQNLSVILERVPAGKSEVRHRHNLAQQFFFILSGTASIEVDGVNHVVPQGTGLSVAAGVPHHFKNESYEDVEFLVVSQPATSGDRENIPSPILAK